MSSVYSGVYTDIGGGSGGGGSPSQPLGTTGGIIAMQYNPIGSAGAKTFGESDMQVKHASLSPSWGADWSLDADGNAYNSNTNRTLISADDADVPDFLTNTRRYSFTWEHLDATPTSDSGIEVRFNNVDNSNHWIGRLVWTGSVWQAVLVEITSSSVDTFLFDNASSAVDWPARGRLDVYESGDDVNVCLSVFELDANTHDDASVAAVSQTNRDHKTNKSFDFRLFNTPGTNMRIRAIEIVDL